MTTLASHWRTAWRTEAAELLKLAPPVIVSQFAGNATMLIGTAVVGRLGSGPLAAVAYAAALYYLFLMVLMGIMMAVGPRAARAHGAGDRVALGLTLRGGVALAALLSGLTIPLMWLLAHELPRFAPASLDSAAAATYLKVNALAMWPGLTTIASRGTLESSGRARTVTLVALTGVAVMLLISPALVFGLKLGVLGAALANVLVSLLVAAVLLTIAWRHAPSAGVRRPELQGELRSLFALGWPIGLTLGAEGGMFNVNALVMGTFGATALASHNVALQIISALFMVPLGLANATGIRVGQARGRGDTAGERRSGLVGLAAAVAVMVVFGLLELGAPRTLISLFLKMGDPANAPVIALASGLLALAALFAVMDGIQVTANAALRGLHDTRVPLLISLTAYWLIGMPSGLLLAFVLDLGPRGLWMGMTLGLAVAAGLLLWRFLKLTRGSPLSALRG